MLPTRALLALRLGLPFALFIGLAGDAAAQGAPPGIEETPTRGVLQPGAGVADGAEPGNQALNPASLGELRALSLGLRHSELTSPGGVATALAGRGTGLYVAAPLPYFSRIQLGGALEVLRPADVAARGRLLLALSLRPLSFLSLGISYGHLFGGAGDGYDGVSSLGLGLRLRAGAHLALGAAVQDLNAPSGAGPGGPALQRVYEGELLGRPLGDERMEIALGARVGEVRADVAPRLRLWARPIPGLGIGAEAAVLLDGGRYDVRAAAGLSIDLEHAGGSAFGVVSGGGGGVTGGGGSVAVRASLERYPALPRGGGAARLLRLEPGKLKGVAFLQLLERLRRLERDRDLGGAVLVLGGLSVGWGRADELRQAVLRLRRAGKRVFVYGADLDTKAYHVASAAERVYVDPAGSLRLLGVSAGTWNVKEALDLVGVRADLVRIGDYKATPETFTRSEPSEPARRQREELVAALHERLLAGLMEGRRLSRAQAAALVDRGLFTPPRARAAGLVDGVLRGDEIESALTDLLGERPRIELPSARPARARSWAPRTIAVVNIEGDLAQGSSRSVPLLDLAIAGGDSVLQALDQADRDGRVVAVVLRVESPGGSALVADVLARRVAELARRKPVVCSFGDVAASGGYYLAAPCGQIFASAATVTGSIGIFGGKVDLSPLMARLGVRRASFARGAHADVDEPYRPYSAEERALIEEQLRHSYDRFLQVVAAGRRLDRAALEPLAGGRVWAGSAAVARRLCDREGGLMDAVAAARRQADVEDGEDLELTYLPQREAGLLQRLLGLIAPSLPISGEEALPGAGRIIEALAGLRAAALLLETPALARMEGEAPR